MNSSRVSYDGSSDGSLDPNQRDQTLRALEGRTDDDYSHITPPDSAQATPDENTADIFMRIAREDTARIHADNGAEDEHSTVVSEKLLDFFLQKENKSCRSQSTSPSTAATLVCYRLWWF